MSSSIVSMLLAGLLGAGIQTSAADGAALETRAVELRQLPREFRLDGVVEATNKTTVSAQTSGQVQEILFDVDDYVEKDSVLVVLKDTEHQTRVSKAAADLKEAVARREEAREEYTRTKEVFAKKLVSASAMDKAEAALKSAKARFEAAQAGLAQAREQLDYTQVRAPYAGIVTQRHVEVGEIAQPGQALISGLSLDHLRVLVDVPQSLAPRIREFGEGKAQAADGVEVALEKITVFPIADHGSNTFKVRADLPKDTQGLFPGMFVKVSFVTGMKQELVAPLAAVVYRSEVTGAYTVDEQGKVHFRHLRLGRATDDGYARILSGLNPGELLALDPIAAGVLLKQQRVESSDG